MEKLSNTIQDELQGNPALQKYIQDLVDTRIDAKLGDFRLELQTIQQTLQQIKIDTPKDRVSILISSYELDKLLPAFIIATGAASFGMEVDLFFTLWGIIALKDKTVYSGKTIPEMMLTMMLPDKPENSGVSRLNMGGMGAMMMKGMMKAENVATLPELMNLATEMGVKMTACQMTMGIMGIKQEELRTDIQYGGVATYIETAAQAKITLFI
jgi:peroxiredoxin family protein